MYCPQHTPVTLEAMGFVTLCNGSQSLMKQHLTNELLRRNRSCAQSANDGVKRINEGEKGSKVKKVITGCHVMLFCCRLWYRDQVKVY